MKKVDTLHYPVVIQASEDGGFVGYAPDVRDAVAKGQTIAEVADEMGVAIATRLTGQSVYPKPSMFTSQAGNFGKTIVYVGVQINKSAFE
ncbi:MAG: type II toxin-antitoxin system HicB family antitoxin [Lactobacillaceae bacterium]|jgi:predicted RNase H-like HicB family nuclease|nr:type II toxin-antitoxin system HicB family antitoxin [Lactobacillaceae bacterium]